MAAAAAQIRERHPVTAADFGVHVVNLAGEAVRRQPFGQRIGIEEGAVDALWRRAKHAVQSDCACGHDDFSFNQGLGAVERLERSAVELRHGYGCKIDVFQAANVDRGHAIALGIAALAIGVDAADRTEHVLDGVLVEGVAGGVLLGREQLQLVAGNEPEQRTLALADRAVAGHGFVQRSFDFEGNAATVTASAVVHSGAPGVCVGEVGGTADTLRGEFRLIANVGDQPTSEHCSRRSAELNDWASFIVFE